MNYKNELEKRIMCEREKNVYIKMEIIPELVQLKLNHDLTHNTS